MADYTYHRIAGYVFTILLHTSNSIYMDHNIMDIDKIPELKNFIGLQPRYFTCWNFGLQVIYAIIALICETLTLLNSHNNKYRLNKHLKALRDILFAGIIWPCTMLVFSLFWTLFYIDRDLILPKAADKVLTPLSNHVIHTLIVPIVLWEVTFRPRHPPKSHRRNLVHLVLHMITYFAVMAYTYNEVGIWIYPIFTKFYGTIYFPIMIATIGILGIIYYYVQWPLTTLIWGKEGDLKKYS